MTFLEAAITVLRHAGRPMTVAEIVDTALSRGLIKPQGRTPEATLSARLYLAVKNDDVPGLERVFKPGPTGAARDSVRWALQHQRAQSPD